MPFSCSTMDSTRGKSNDFPCVTASGFEFRARSGGQGARLPDPARRAVAPHSDQPPPKVGHGSQENGDWTNGLSQHALLREKITPSQSRNQEAEEETASRRRVVRPFWSSWWERVEGEAGLRVGAETELQWADDKRGPGPSGCWGHRGTGGQCAPWRGPGGGGGEEELRSHAPT